MFFFVEQLGYINFRTLIFFVRDKLVSRREKESENQREKEREREIHLEPNRSCYCFFSLNLK